jgi:RNase P subunit RPR2
MLFKCKECEYEYEGLSRSRMRYHVELKHVMEIRLIEGKDTIIIKRKEGEFECLCGKRSKVPKTMYRHKKCFFGKDKEEKEEMKKMIEEIIKPIDCMEMEAVEAAEATRGNEERKLEILAKYGIEYREEYKLLVCKGCKNILYKNFKEHIEKRHGIKMGKEEEKEILKGNFWVESGYFKRKTEVLVAVDFIKIDKWFRCGICNYSCKTKKRIKQHVRKEHEEGKGTYKECLVQKISGEKCFKRYIEVLKGSEGEEGERGENNSE